MSIDSERKTLQKVHVISLDRTPQRYELFCRFNAHIDHVRVSACEGALLNKDECIAQGLFGEELTYSSGAMGSAVSHIRIWKDAVYKNEMRHIAEDDAIIRLDFSQMFQQVTERCRDWDVILWSYNDDWPVGIVSTFGRVAALKEQEISPEFIAKNHRLFQQETREPVLLPLASAAGIGFYSVTPRGAKRLLDACLPLQRKLARYASDTNRGWHNGALDVEMSRHYENLKAYVSYPPLAIMINDSANSTICGNDQFTG
ncbi:glycosyltransferase family 25 protein [Acetobacter indonesiensis]